MTSISEDEAEQAQPRTGEGTDDAERSRQRLLDLKASLGGTGDTPSSTPTLDEGSEINEFLKDLVGRKQTRKHQLALIKDLFDNPMSFGININAPPTSTTAAEVEQRRSELGYRIALLRGLLTASEHELDMLESLDLNGAQPEDDG